MNILTTSKAYSEFKVRRISLDDIKLFDLLGKEVNVQLESESATSVKFLNLEAGIYFLSYNDGINRLMEKVVVEVGK